MEVSSIDLSFSQRDILRRRYGLHWVAICVRLSPISFTFLGDAENCLSDSVVEMQIFLVTLLREFYISQADHHPQIRRARSGLMVPLVLGEEYKGTQLPLKISAIRSK